MENSVKAYKVVCKVLGVTPAKITEKIIIPDGTTLVIVPDKAFGYKKLFKLAEEFGKDQPYSTYIYEDLYKQYTPNQLSGAPTGKDCRIVLIPKKHNVRSDTAENQRKSLKTGRVPSVLEAITHWFVLRENGSKLDFDSTYIRHFDLEPKRFVGWSYLPSSYVGDDGRPYLYRSSAEGQDGGRVSVEYELESIPSVSSLDTSEVLSKFYGEAYNKGFNDALDSVVLPKRKV